MRERGGKWVCLEHVYVKNEGKREKHLWNTPIVGLSGQENRGRQRTPKSLVMEKDDEEPLQAAPIPKERWINRDRDGEIEIEIEIEIEEGQERNKEPLTRGGRQGKGEGGSTAFSRTSRTIATACLCSRLALARSPFSPHPPRRSKASPHAISIHMQLHRFRYDRKEGLWDQK
jgi:hypothetical protein